MPRGKRAALLLLGGAEATKQERVALDYTAERRYSLTTLTGSASDALVLVEAGLVDVVVVAFSTRGTDDLAVDVRAAGGCLEAVRRTVSARHDPRSATIREAAERGATPEMIAAVLGVPVAEVEHVLATPAEARGARRPERPQERRPEPVRQPSRDHPWLLDNRAAFPGRPTDFDQPAPVRPAERRPQRVRWSA